MIIQRKQSAATLIISAALVCALAACAAGTSTTAQQRPVNPAPPTATSPNPALITQSADDAVRLATPYLAGQAGTMHAARDVTAVMYVETTVRQAASLIGFGTNGMNLDATAWLFIEHGKFQEVGYRGQTPRPPASTLWVLVSSQIPLPLAGQDARADDLVSLGSPTVIPPGQVSEIDAVRVTGSPSAPTP